MTGASTQADRLRLAEQVCLMFGWTGVGGNTDRDKALHELWVEWLRAYEAAGGSTVPIDHPELSDARIEELARRRDEIVARTLARIRTEGA